ncbi:MAG TPA: hypothetical protein VF350_00755 [Candidatus Bathyarchaeia archaeon]
MVKVEGYPVCQKTISVFEAFSFLLDTDGYWTPTHITNPPIKTN